MEIWNYPESRVGIKVAQAFPPVPTLLPVPGGYETHCTDTVRFIVVRVELLLCELQAPGSAAPQRGLVRPEESRAGARDRTRTCTPFGRGF